MSDEMPDSTRELLNAHHASILRELNLIHSNVRADIASVKADIQGARDRLESHNAKIGVLQWAYGLGVFIIGTILALMGFRRI